MHMSSFKHIDRNGLMQRDSSDILTSVHSGAGKAIYEEKKITRNPQMQRKLFPHLRRNKDHPTENLKKKETGKSKEEN